MSANDELTKIKVELKKRQDTIIDMSDDYLVTARLCKTLLSALERSIKQEKVTYEEKKEMKQETEDLCQSIDLFEKNWRSLEGRLRGEEWKDGERVE